MAIIMTEKYDIYEITLITSVNIAGKTAYIYIFFMLNFHNPAQFGKTKIL